MAFSNYIPEQHDQGGLQQEELQFSKFLMGSTLNAIFWVEKDARFLYVNDAACFMVSYSREELLSMTMYDVDSNLSPKVWSEHWKTVKQQGTLYFESQHQTKEGRSFPIEIVVTYVEYYGREYGCIFVRDITKRKQLEVCLHKNNEALECRVQERTTELRNANEQLRREITKYKWVELELEKSLSLLHATLCKYTESALRQSEAKFRTWAETTDAIIFIVKSRQICYINPLAEVVTGYKPEELLDHYDFCQQLKVKEIGLVSKQGGSEFPRYQEIKVITKSGEERWLDCSVGVLKFEGKLATLVIAIDITNKKQVEAEIRATLKQEKELGEHRARFASIVSHEFRTPLNIISFSTSLLKRHSRQWTEEKKLDYIHRIQTGVEQLNHLLDQVLIISGAEAGKLTFEPRMLDLDQFCRDLVAQLQLSDSTQHTVTFESLGDCSTACVDEKLLNPILTNLLSNAIKYSFVGSTINFAISCQSGKAIFQIKDKGIGIPATDRQLLFEPFHRGRNVGDIPGTGLGLAVVKKLVDTHGGQITVESEVGVGTAFTLELPLCQSVEAGGSTSLILSIEQLDSRGDNQKNFKNG